MNVLSLFDGISAGQVALQRAGIEYDKYYASEIEKPSIKVTQKNFPNTIQLGDVCKVKVDKLPTINLLLAGSPCQSFSPTISSNTGFDGKSKLFFEFLRILKECNEKSGGKTKFLLENVRMKKEWEDVITKHVGVEPVYINSSLFSAQDRPRLYWTNIDIPKLPQKNDEVLGDILETNVDKKYFYLGKSYTRVNKGAVEAILDINGHDILKRVNSKDHKCQCLTAVCGGNQHKKVIDSIAGVESVRKLTPIEYERLQQFPDGFTDGVSDSARYRSLGNSWTISVISHILNGLKV